MLMDRPVEYRRLQAPRHHGQALIEPALTAVSGILESNRQRLASYEVDLQGRSLTQLAESAREELLLKARHYTSQYRHVDSIESMATRQIVLAGHQPELFHPGVWFKNFVLGKLSETHGAVAVNLLIDSDTCREASIRVPSGTLRDPTVNAVPFDHPSSQIPYEERKIHDFDLFRSFGDRAGNTVRSFVAEPIVRRLWPFAIQRAKENAKLGANLGESLAQARHLLEEQLGLSTLEIPQSTICGLESFHWFSAHLFAQLPRLWDAYNQAVTDYRAFHRIRSKAHPVPNLATQDGWLEAPFWMWTDSDPQRRAVYARPRGDQLVLSNGAQQEFVLTLTAEGDADQACQELAALARRGIKLRTRATITTMFARLLLGDLFLHGIGGAKYDEMTDQLICRFFGVEPPEFMVVSATMRLPIPRPPIDVDARRQITHALRDLTYHPEQRIEEGLSFPSTDRKAIDEIIARKRKWIATPPTVESGRARHVGITEANASLQPWVEKERHRLQEAFETVVRAERAERVLASREYAFCLFPQSTFDELRAQVD